MGKTQHRQPAANRSWTREWAPAHDWSHDDDQAVLDREEESRHRHGPRGRVERSSWHDEGVVSDYHTD